MPQCSSRSGRSPAVTGRPVEDGQAGPRLPEQEEHHLRADLRRDGHAQVVAHACRARQDLDDGRGHGQGVGGRDGGAVSGGCGRRLNDGFVAQGAKLRQEVLAHAGVCGRAGGVGL